MKILLLIFFLPCLCLAQHTFSDDLELSIKGKTGFLAAHRGTMGHLYKDRLFAFELSLSKRLHSKNWSNSYKNPYVGVTLYGSNLGNKAILGYGFGAYGFMEFPWNRSDKFIVSGKLSAGIGVATKVFDQQKNPKNDAISTHVNALICLGVNARWYVHKNHALILGLDLTHFSNGSSKVPNLGLNMPYLSLGYSYKIKEKSVELTQIEIFQRVPFIKNWNVSLVGIVTSKEIFPTGGKRYPIFALSTFLYKQFRPKVGAELAFDIISKQSIMGYRTYIPKNQWDVLQLGVYLGYSLPLDRFRFVIGMGYYMKDRFDQDDEFYHRVGMRYQFDNGLLLNLVLKSHWARADYIEYGVGYTFKYKNRYHAL